MASEKTKALIFAVDDEPDILKLIQLSLTNGGLVSEGFTSGAELLERLSNSPGPDLVILDVMMPDMNGFDVCRQIRKNRSLTHIPVVFLTAKTFDRDYQEGLASGGTAYLEKPFDVQLFPEKVRMFLRGKGKI